jgi:hypothetical protein
VTRIVRTRSIPNVDVERLQGDLGRLHAMLHTPEGLHDWDMPRRSLFDNGMKARAIATELHRRGVAPTGCRFCAPRL